MKALADGEIKEGTYIKVHDLSVLDEVVTTILYTNQKLNWETGTFDTSYLSNNYCYFEPIEEQQDIDIQAIEEYKTEYAEGGAEFDLRNYINKKILPAIKQLDKNINKKHCEVCGVELDQNNTALPNMCWECKYGEER